MKALEEREIIKEDSTNKKGLGTEKIKIWEGGGGQWRLYGWGLKVQNLRKYENDD